MMREPTTDAELSARIAAWQAYAKAWEKGLKPTPWAGIDLAKLATATFAIATPEEKS